MKSFIGLFTIIFLISCQAPVKKEIPAVDQYNDAIDSARAIVTALMKTNQTPGMSISVSVNSEMVWSEGFGFADVENSVPVDPSKTMFRIGSVSKTLTSSAMGKLMESGSLDPEEIIQTYVPYFPKKKFPITVKQVAGHIGGIRHYRGRENWSDVNYPTVKDGLTIFQDDTLLFEPGSDYSYSSYAWNLISAVVEGAANEDFLPYMQTNVFDPLGMTSTSADFAPDEMPNRTKFYVRENDEVVPAPYVDNSYKWAGGGFISTTEDLIKYGESHMTSGYLKKETLDALQEPQVLNNGDTTEYGMGWFSGIDERGYYYVGHSGGSVGGITQFWIYPKQEVIVAMLSNCSPLDYDDADTRIAWLFMESKQESD